jgi:DNA polymerase-3 subunit chi
MTERVDFYVLSSTLDKQRWMFACRLAEKAYLKELRVTIVSAGQAEAKALDDLLWTFSDRSFVPHELCEREQGTDPGIPVHITSAADALADADLLVNLTDRLPAGFERFSRIAEIIDADPERRRAGRERFRSYREKKVTLETHQLDDNADVQEKI